jgi:predicted DNA-binding transcriptional regulator AlpA
MQTHIRADEKAAEKREAVATTLANLPSDLGRSRIFDAATASAFWGVSLPHWRRLYRARKVPQPIKLGERKLGWRVGVLVDALAARDSEIANASVR